MKFNKLFGSGERPALRVLTARKPSAQHSLLFACAVLSIVITGCSDSSSNGGSGAGPDGAPVVLTTDGDGSISLLEEQLTYEILPSVGVETVDVVRWRWSQEPIRSGALAECGGRENFDLNLAVGTLEEACTLDSSCNFSFDQTADTNNSGQVATRFLVDVPILKSPVGLTYELEATTNLDETLISTTTFCLVPINEAPVAADDAFTVVQGEALVVTSLSQLNLLSNDADDVDTSNQAQLSIATTPLAAPQLASEFTLGADGSFIYRFDGDLSAFPGNRATDAFTYQVTDGVNTATAVVRLTIVDRDDPPVQTSEIPSHIAIAGIATEFDFSGNFEDPENSQLLFSVVPGSLPPASSLDVSVLGVLSGVAASEDVGNFTVSVQASDTVNPPLNAGFLLTVVENQQPGFSQPGDISVEFGQLLIVDTAPNFSDPEGQPLTFSLTTEPATGLSINPDNGLISGTIDEPGTYTFTVTASDGFSTPVSTQFAVTQSEQPNRTPVLRTPIANQGVTVGNTITAISGDFVDLDGDTLTYSISSIPEGLDFNPATGVLSGTASSVGIFNLTITATDSEGAAATSDTFTLTVTAVPNDPPVLASNVPDQSGVVGQSIDAFSASFTDPQSQTLTFSASGLPGGLTINPETGLVTGVPQEEGNFNVSIVAEDSIGDSTTSNTFVIAIALPPNEAPVFNGTIASQTIVLGTALETITVSFSDPEGDALTFSATGLPSNVSINSSTGTISGTPGAEGTSTVVVTATDTDGESVSSNPFTITVSPIPNNGPVFNGPIAAQTAVTGDAITPLVLASFFSDIDGDDLSFALASGSSLPAGLSLNAAGTISGTPTATGNTNVTVTATDSDGESVSSNTFVFTVTAANIAPQITGTTPSGDFSILLNGTETLEVAITDESVSTVTVSASSSDSDVVQLTGGDGVNEFDLEAVAVGTAEILIIAVDNEGLSDSITIDVTVDPLPNANPQIGARTPSGSPITISIGDSEDVSIAVTDEDVSTLVYSASSTDDDIATVTSNGAGSYTVEAIASGSVTITLEVEDDAGQTDTESFVVNVPAVNLAPEITGRDPAADPITSIDIDDTDPVTFTVTDEDPSTLVFTASSSDATIVVVDDIDQSDGIVFLEGLAAGTATITVTVTDSDGLTDSESFDVEVPAPVNAAPEVNGTLPDVSFVEGLPITTIDISGIFTDPDGDALSYTAVGLPDDLELDSDTGDITGTASQLGTFTVVVSATDPSGSNTSVTAPSFEIEITAAPVINQPPTANGPLADQSFVDGTVLIAGDLNVAALFEDPEGDVLSYSAVGLPTDLELDPDTGDITGTASPEGTFTVVVSAIDVSGSNTSVTAPSFGIEIAAAPTINQPPEANGPLADQSFVEGTELVAGDLNVAALFTDSDGDALSYTALGLPDDLELDGESGEITGTASPEGTFTVVVSAIDVSGSNTSVTAPPFDIEITAAPVANLPPVFNGPIPDLNLTLDATIPPQDLSVFFSDPENDTLSFDYDQLPTGLTLSPSTGILEGTPTLPEQLEVVISAVDSLGSGTIVLAEAFEIEIE